MLNVCIHPTWKRTDRADGGIRRVSEAQWKYLPEFDIQPVFGTIGADLIATHGTARVNIHDKPIVNHNHGLYWDCHEWPSWAHEANKQVAEAMVQAVSHSAPSKWVANALTRGMLVYPEVIYHGVDAEEWIPGENRDYILWNKARTDPVSNPNDMQELATHLSHIRFASTIGKATKNVKIIGTMPIDEMKEWVRHAGLYLCTARETFGIGTLEAMACGVPVVGWDWGGQREIIKHGETGFLAKPGDYEALAEGIKWSLSNRNMLGGNAREDVLANWGWQKRIKQYAELYHRTWDWWNKPECKVSVIVTCHNLAKYLSDCLKSVAEQDFEDWECIVVDDDSKDDTSNVAKQWENIDDRFRYVKTPENLKLPGARNFGFTHSKGKYIKFLDADDMLAEHALRTLSGALDIDGSIHIAYGHLDTVREDGNNRQRSNGWPFQGFSWYGQMAHLNQLPYSSMMRREVMERSGGYRVRNWRAEDAAFWIHATSFGFRAAKVTQASTLVYRWRTNSKTQHEDGDGDWTAWYPWRLGAETGKQGMKIFNGMVGVANHPRPDLVPFGAHGPPSKKFWPVPDHTNPFVSVVIPVGPKHDKYVIDALDSVVAQTFQNWEAIVVNATGKKWPDGFESPVAGAPYAKVIDAGKVLKPAAARNLGAKHARGHAILWLDADDILISGVLEEMMEIYLGTDGGLVYTDWLRGLSSKDEQKPLELYKSPEFECGAIIKTMQHAMMCLVPRSAHEKIGGFDENMPGWEDWDYLIALQSIGVCSYRLERPGFVYRFYAGGVREDNYERREELKAAFYEKWKDYAERKKTMPCGGCPGKRRVSIKKSPVKVSVEELEEGAVLLEYQGPRTGKVHRRGPVTNAYYIFRHNQPRYVDSRDAEEFLKSLLKDGPEFVRIAKPTEIEPAVPANFIQSEVIEAQRPMDLPSMEPSAPEMPGTIKELKSVINAQDKKTIYNWLEQEQNKEKPRKGALKFLKEKLDA